MTKRLFIWVAHPKADSLCAGIADAYQAGAEARGAMVRRMDLSTMAFDPAFQGYGADAPALEPDLAAWQANI
ncbi:MAG: NAD(P)H-dependent oxidoreductase, partial [Alphaproteobacteria bacterium]|nr:NAD(P)H-dependent oxidoreductase [Alphaproteobacteria bacterium]